MFVVVVVVRIYYLLKMFKVLRLKTSIGIEKSIDTSGIDQKVLVPVFYHSYVFYPPTGYFPRGIFFYSFT